MTVWNPLVWHVGYLSELPSGDQMQFGVGSAASPSITFRGHTNTGLYWSATQVNISIGGVLHLSISASALNVTGDVVASGNVSGVGGAFSGNVSGVNGNFTGLIEQNGNTVIDTNRLIQLRNYVVASLPASPPDGATAFVTDSTQTLTAGIGTPVVGGSANKVPVYGDSGVWLIG